MIDELKKRQWEETHGLNYDKFYDIVRIKRGEILTELLKTMDYYSAYPESEKKIREFEKTLREKNG